MTRRRRKRRKEALDIHDAVLDTLAHLGLTDQAHGLRIAAAWRDAVGEKLASRTEPVRLSRGILTVRAASSAWLNELTYLKASLIPRLNDALGSTTVRDIRPVAGPLTTAPVAEPPPVWMHERPSATDKERITDALKAIDDVELREHVRRVMTRDACARRHLPGHD